MAGGRGEGGLWVKLKNARTFFVGSLSRAIFLLNRTGRRDMNLKRFLGYCMSLHCLVGEGEGRDIEVKGGGEGRETLRGEGGGGAFGLVGVIKQHNLPVQIPGSYVIFEQRSQAGSFSSILNGDWQKEDYFPPKTELLCYVQGM
jgi:hypothetical protein